MAPDDPPRHLLKQALAAFESRRWTDARSTYAALAWQLVRQGEAAAAAEAEASAADAAFRADLPRDAARHLERALERVPAHAPAALRYGVQQVGAWMEQGDLDAASRQLDGVETRLEALQADGLEGVRMLTLDGRIGLLLQAGEVQAADRAWAVFDRWEHPAARPAVLYRQGQIRRRQGDLQEAVEALEHCVASCRGQRPFDGPRGAASAELAECFAMAGRMNEATFALDEAREAWRAARRQSGVWRCRAAAMRFAAAPPAGARESLEQALLYARQRGLAVLETELLQTAARVFQDRERGRQALRLAERQGARHAVGRIRVLLNQGEEGDPEALRRACAELEEAPPWLAQARLALARANARKNRGGVHGCDLATEALERFEEMGMSPWVERARRLLDDITPRA